MQTLSLPYHWQAFDPMLGELAERAISAIADRGELERICPRHADIFKVFEMLRPDRIRCVAIGQDPYPNPADAMGIAFSSRAAKLPASLRNIFHELVDDIGQEPPSSANLTHWVEQGVFLANTALTLAHDGSTHFKIWKAFTDRWIATLARSHPVVWVLWGNHAKKWAPMIQTAGVPAHLIIESTHPGPLSAYKGFFGSKPFSRVNAGLRQLGHPEIQW